MSAFDFVHRADRKRTERAFTGWLQDKRSNVTFENRQVNQVTGEIREMLWTVSLGYDEKENVTSVNSIARDLTDRRKLADALLRTERLESLGTLSGGIAHDFNNLLSIILGNLSLLKYDMKGESKSQDYLQEAENASFRANELTARLITFSKGGDPVKKVMATGAFVKESVQSALDGTGMACEMAIPDDLFPVAIDAAQMKQVINHIAVNAYDAMDGKGEICVRCENIAIADKDPLQIEAGDYVRISIGDQGTGIAEEDLGRIFDPYFSTKERSEEKGTGLGLSVCHSILEKHNGLIPVESEWGTGSTFTLYLPASDEQITEPEPPEEELLKEPVGGSGKLLVMDDEAMIRTLAINRLGRLGYDVEVASDGVEAIERYRNAMDSGKPFNVVILDLTSQMGMGGKETIRKLHDIDPDVKGIVATGYSNDSVVTNCRGYGFKGALTKPYTTYELSRVLHDVIAENP